MLLCSVRILGYHLNNLCELLADDANEKNNEHLGEEDLFHRIGAQIVKKPLILRRLCGIIYSDCD